MENVKEEYINPYTDLGFKSQAKLNIARSLKASGLDVDFIAKNTGLSIDEINNL